MLPTISALGYFLILLEATIEERNWILIQIMMACHLRAQINYGEWGELTGTQVKVYSLLVPDQGNVWFIDQFVASISISTLSGETDSFPWCYD